MATSAAALVAVGAAMAVPATASPATATQEAKPTVVLVHGAFADSSGWKGVIARLTHDGYPVRTVSNPLRGLPTDTAAAKDVLRSIHGPIVLVGHSYGGAVITNAAAGNPNVKALVYLAALAPDAGEKAYGPSDVPIEHPLPPLSVDEVPTVAADGTVSDDLYLPQDEFRERFAPDVDPATAAAMAATQRPLDKGANSSLSTAAAWRTIPSWYLVTKDDQIGSPELERFFAKRAHSHTEEIDSSHAVMVSHPGAVTHMIEEADYGTR
ncbi:alpha/beta fold hydrolase [Streptomyces canus]|uniref:alpha/beta fold hydrolase n=1 Tax=Streptomyces canus TaxID=58343 RepID=UPI000368310D|nr:alpha/beta hydrolase [Streptomyces canus]